MIPLRDLSAPAVALEWHEAVAVVAALTATVWNARASQAPTLDAAVLTPEGDVALAGAGRLPGPVTSGLAVALGALLESTPCPAELRQIVTANLGPSPEIDSLSAFARALMFFERPGRAEVLRDLATRAAVRLEEARAHEELERLTERARERAEQAAEPASDASLPDGAAVRRMIAPAAVAVAVFVAVAFAAATLFTTAQSPDWSDPGVTTGPVEDDEAAGPEAARPAASTAAPARSSSAPSAASGAPPRAPAGSSSVRAREPGVSGSSRTASGATPGGSAPASPGAPGGSGIVVTVTELGGAPLSTNAPSAIPGAARSTSPIYVAGDAGVSPAVLVKPHLPAEPPADVPPWEVGTLELTVGTMGTVEQVHLISPYNRYQERMLVAAAKAWLFQPATKDGRPVRFRALIRVTL